MWNTICTEQIFAPSVNQTHDHDANKCIIFVYFSYVNNKILCRRLLLTTSIRVGAMRTAPVRGVGPPCSEAKTTEIVLYVHPACV